ncbi:DUF4184 family protein [Streptacidiphilus fuscans]|uniref:DUF4184 family protein n=1 Tax=Streptacidiphilus fuscans TaxID=2789292 RepID=A0A931FEB9_9ACTN|nr:DUF4184 family protein [Streptacidiphilus fuscans]MBF9068481.1 DUF4184 family protein [Streptacidiphilus fuscans]
MPFTFSHPAAVLPLLRAARPQGPLIASGLVAGSLAPDVPYFVDSLLPGAYAVGRLTHRAWAVPTLNVAIAAGVAAVWYGLGPRLGPGVERGLEQGLGHGLGREPAGRIAEPCAADWAQDAAWFAASAAVGAFTHVAWDEFTHHGRFGERHIPALGHRIGGRMPVYQALQWASSMAGLAVLGRAASRTPRARDVVREVASAVSPAATALVGAATVVGAVHRARRDRARRPEPFSGNDLVASVSFGGGAGAAVGAVAAAAVGSGLRALAPRSLASAHPRLLTGGSPGTRRVGTRK